MKINFKKINHFLTLAAENLFLSFILIFLLSIISGLLMSYNNFLDKKEHVDEYEITLFDEDLYNQISEKWKNYEQELSQLKIENSFDMFRQRIIHSLPEEELEEPEEGLEEVE